MYKKQRSTIGVVSVCYIINFFFHLYSCHLRKFDWIISIFIFQKSNLTEVDTVFIEEIFFGCQKYSKVLKILLNGFFAKGGGTCLRSEQNLLKGEIRWSFVIVYVSFS